MTQPGFERPSTSATFGAAAPGEFTDGHDRPVEFAEREHLPPVLYGVASISKDERAGIPNGRPNQDSTYPHSGGGQMDAGATPDAFVIADGVGGQAGGETASRIATSTFPAAVERFRAAHYLPKAVLKKALSATDIELRRQKDQGSCPHDAATTIVGAVRIDGDTWGLAAAGDSTAFVVRTDGSVEQVVREQSYENQPNVMYNSMNGEPHPEHGPRSPKDQFVFVKLMPGDRLVMVTDGIVGDWTNQKIAPETIAETVRQYQGDPQGAADALLRLPRELTERGYRYPGFGQDRFIAPDENGNAAWFPAGTPFKGKLGDDASAIVIERPLKDGDQQETRPTNDETSVIERLNRASDEQLLVALQNEQFRGTEVDGLIRDIYNNLGDEFAVDYIKDRIWQEWKQEPSPSTVAAVISRSLRILHNEDRNPGANTGEAQLIPHFLYDHLNRITNDDGTLDEERLRSEKVALALALQYLFNSDYEDEDQARLRQIESIAKRQRGEETEV